MIRSSGLLILNVNLNRTVLNNMRQTMKHWTYPFESPTRFNQVYTACKIYVDLREVRYQPNNVTCKKCKQLMMEFESEQIEP